MKVLVACEKSGVVRAALRRLGHDAWSNDIEPAEDDSPYHIIGDAREVIRDKWDGLVAHPECRYLAVSGMHWNRRIPGRNKLTAEALEFARVFFEADIPHKVIENPISILSTHFRKPDQIVQPYQFGADASKQTCLWLFNVPKLFINPAHYVPPRLVWHNGKMRERWANQTDSGQNRLAPSETRSADRARTYPLLGAAIADAMDRASLDYGGY